jgi:exodeoxyribonuclease V gamma subunit
MPMRSIPFKAVCLLGMNDQDYPRQVTPVGFDLMVQGRARRGDRSRREDDRYLVLEALCSAQDKFYISYRGRDARENHELQPSVLVSELMDYVGDAYCLEGDEKLPARDSRERLRTWLIEELPLQPFNRRTYEPEKQNESEQSNVVAGYHKLWADVANADHSDRENRPFYSEPVATPEGFSRKQVLWSDVKESLLKPAGFFLKRRLKLQPDLYMTQSRNEEIFQPDALENSQLKQRWMQDQLANMSAEIPDFTYREQALGSLPVNALGDIYVSRVEQELTPLLADVKRFISGDADSGALTLVVSDPQATDVNNTTVEISGEYAQCWNHQLVYWRAGDLRGEHLLNLWLDFVFAVAAQPGLVEMAVIVGGKKKPGEIIFNAPSQDEAIRYVQQCLMHYFASWTSPQTALPGVQWALLRADDAKRMDTLKKQAESEFSEFNRTAMQRCHPDLAATLLAGGLDDWLESHRWIWALPEHCLQQSSNQEAGA